MTNPTPTPNTQLPAIVGDGFDFDPTESPLKGVAFRFNEGTYENYGDPVDVEGKSYAVIRRTKGWQKAPDGPMPRQPEVAKEHWPMDLNGKPAHPWKLTHYVYLRDTDTGEFSTLWTNTTGGNLAIGELKDQIELMRHLNPHAMPVIALQAKDMPTQYGSTKPRPYFKILGWMGRGAGQNLLDAPEQKLIDVEKPSLKEEMKDEIPWSDPVSDIGKIASKKK
jgi:hypothetical protein